MTTGKVAERDAELAHEITLSGNSRYFDPTLSDKITAALATVRQEVEIQTWRDAILLLDTAPLCHCAGKQYVDPVALVQRMNAALESAAKQEKQS